MLNLQGRLSALPSDDAPASVRFRSARPQMNNTIRYAGEAGKVPWERGPAIRPVRGGLRRDKRASLGACGRISGGGAGGAALRGRDARRRTISRVGCRGPCRNDGLPGARKPKTDSCCGSRVPFPFRGRDRPWCALRVIFPDAPLSTETSEPRNGWIARYAWTSRVLQDESDGMASGGRAIITKCCSSGCGARGGAARAVRRV